MIQRWIDRFKTDQRFRWIVILVIALFAVTVWPTEWRSEDIVVQGNTVRKETHRFTGEVRWYLAATGKRIR